MKKFLKSNWILLVILLLAAFFRFWQINTLPGGLFPDEAANGLDIISMAHGQIQPFYERGNGREALFFYFEGLSTWLFGKGVWQFHIVSAAFGFFAVLGVYLLAKRLLGKNVALMSAFLMAVSAYPVDVTRTAFRANMVPLLSTLTLLFLVKCYQAATAKEKYWSAGLAGMCFALGFYTYPSFRMMLPLILGFGILIVVGLRHRFRQLVADYTRYKLVFLASFLVFISWLASYFIAHPDSFVGRSGQVSIFNINLNHGDLFGTFFSVFKATVLAFFTHGDLNWRHNISGFPFLPPMVSPLFAAAWIIFTIAIVRLLWQVWKKQLDATTVYQALIATWFWFMLAPEVSTAEGIPHGLRLTGTIAPLFIMSGYGFQWLWRRIRHWSFLTHYRYYFLGIFAATLIIYNFNLYFTVAANSPDYYYAFRSDLTAVSDYLTRRADGAHI